MIDTLIILSIVGSIVFVYSLLVAAGHEVPNVNEPQHYWHDGKKVRK